MISRASGFFRSPARAFTSSITSRIAATKGRTISSLLDKKAKSWGTSFRAHILPHDVEAREWGSGESRRVTLMDATPVPILTADRVNDADGIHAVRGILGITWFDEHRCRRGLARLRGYKKSKFGTPVHDDASHGADAMKTVAVGLPHVTALSSNLTFGGRLRRKIRGLV